MNKLFVSVFFTIAFFATAQAQYATSYGGKIAEKRFDSSSLPPNFKNYKGTLIVSSDIKPGMNRRRFEKLMEEYEGKYEIVSAGKDLSEDFPNTSKDQFILHVGGGVYMDSENRKGSPGAMKENYSHLGVMLYITNRFTNEKFNYAFGNADYWQINLQYLLLRLNMKLHQKN